MDSSFISEILRHSDMVSLEQGLNIFHLLSRTILLGVEGEVVELGCCHGLTAVLIRKTLDCLNSSKIFRVYDSFEGLPEKSEKDGDISFSKGECHSTRDIFKNNFRKFDLKFPKMYVGWFKDTLPHYLPEKIAFAHLDGDFYTSIMESLEYVYPRLSPGAVVVIDDYCDPDIQKGIAENIDHNAFNKAPLAFVKSDPNYLPGVKVACDEFFADKLEKVSPLCSGYAPHGSFTKL